MVYIRPFVACFKQYKNINKYYRPLLGNVFYHYQICYNGCSSKNNECDLNLKVDGISLNSYIKRLEQEYTDICETKDYSTNSRWRELHSIALILKERKTFVRNINDLRELLNEQHEEIRKLAEEEKRQFENKIKLIDEQLIETLLPDNVEDSYDAIVLEIQAGVGGQEAMLFAKEIFNMYCNFAEYKGWELQIADYLATDIGGVRHAVALISGHSVFQYFKHEVGIHRVQRTPITEKTGRIHTSTISVIALPQPTDIQVNINPRDLKIETKRSTGAGGQHVNTTDSAVRITHLPSGISVECQVDRSQIKNRKMAMARLNALLYQKELDNQTAETHATRKSQVRNKNRNEKIRTYNYNQDRITDHRLKTGSNIHNLEAFLEGGETLDQLVKKLEKQNRIDSLLNIVNS